MRTLIRRLVRLSTDKMSPVDGDMSSCIGDVSSCIMVHPRLLYRDVSSHIMSHLVWLMMVCCLDINSRANNCTAIFLFFLSLYFFLSSRTPSLSRSFFFFSLSLSSADSCAVAVCVSPYQALRILRKRWNFLLCSMRIHCVMPYVRRFLSV